MATITSNRGASTQAVPQAVGGGVCNVQWGTATLAANPTAADIIEFFTLPARATVLDGWLYAPDLDSGTDALDIDIGWLGNGVEATDTDGFGNMGVLNGAAITNLKPETGIRRPLGGVLYTTGPQFFTNETKIRGLVNVAANAGGTGVITLYILYAML